MTPDEIKNLAKIAFAECDHIPNTKIPKEFVLAFAKLVAAKKEKDIIKTIQSPGTWATCEQIEKAIKVRGIK